MHKFISHSMRKLMYGCLGAWKTHILMCGAATGLLRPVCGLQEAVPLHLSCFPFLASDQLKRIPFTLSTFIPVAAFSAGQTRSFISPGCLSPYPTHNHNIAPLFLKMAPSPTLIYNLKTHPHYDAEECRHQEYLRRCMLATHFSEQAVEHQEDLPEASQLYDILLKYNTEWIESQLVRPSASSSNEPSIGPCWMRRTELWRKEWEDIVQGRTGPTDVRCIRYFRLSC